jgi:hypothetical protein
MLLKTVTITAEAMISWECGLARGDKIRMHTEVSEGNILENVHLEDQERHGRTSL